MRIGFLFDSERRFVGVRVRLLLIALTIVLGLGTGLVLNHVVHRGDGRKSIKRLVWELQKQEGTGDKIWQTVWSKLPQIAQGALSPLAPTPAHAMRAAAARDLGELKPKDASVVNALIKALNDTDVRVQELAIEALGSIGPSAAPAVPVLILEFKTGLHRPTTARALAAIAPDNPAVIEALKDAAREKDVVGAPAPIASVAVQVLAGIATPTNSIGSFLLAVFEDSDIAALRTEIVSVLPKMHWQTDATVAALSRRLEVENSHWAVSSIVSALSEIGQEASAAAPVLVRLYARARESRQMMRVPLVRPAGPPVPGGPDRTVRTERLPAQSDLSMSMDPILRALGRMGPAAKDALPMLVEDSSNADNSYRISAAIARWQIAGRSDEVLWLVLGALNHQNVVVRRSIIGRLKDVGPEAAPLLLHAMTDSDRINRKAALVGFAEVEKDIPTLVRVLGEQLKDPELTMRLTALHLLSQQGEEAKSAMPAIEKLLHDPKNAVRFKAELVVKQLSTNSDR